MLHARIVVEFFRRDLRVAMLSHASRPAQQASQIRTTPQQSDLDVPTFNMLGSASPRVISRALNCFMYTPLSNVVSPWSCCLMLLAALLTMTYLSPKQAMAQTEDAFSDAAADPVKLFERGQNAHARGDLLKALEFYDEAIKVRPEFSEAEFQRGNVLTSLGRPGEAETSFKRSIELRKDWSLPYVALGTLLARQERGPESEPFLRKALQLDSKNSLALRVLADVRLRAGDAREALELARRATNDQDAPLATWILRAQAERRAGDNSGALASLDHILAVEPGNLLALLERAEVHIEARDLPRALEDLKTSEPLIKDEKANAARVAAAYERAGKPDDARRIAESAGLNQSAATSQDGGAKVLGAPEEIAAANSDDPAVARAALEKLLQKNPDNAMLLARLGESYRTADPSRSLDFYRRANKLQPANPDYAAGFSSALVQARRFPEAVSILRKVIEAAPDNYAAHANLATALYRLKQYTEALEEYRWLLNAKPDLVVAHYFIATAHDYLGEYQAALTAYEFFLAGADTKTNQLEIDKVNLRLPSLRRQIKMGQGAKRKAEPPARPRAQDLQQ